MRTVAFFVGLATSTKLAPRTFHALRRLIVIFASLAAFVGAALFLAQRLRRSKKLKAARLKGSKGLKGVKRFKRVKRVKSVKPVKAYESKGLYTNNHQSV